MEGEGMEAEKVGSILRLRTVLVRRGAMGFTNVVFYNKKGRGLVKHTALVKDTEMKSIVKRVIRYYWATGAIRWTASGRPSCPRCAAREPSKWKRPCSVYHPEDSSEPSLSDESSDDDSDATVDLAAAGLMRG